MRDAGLKKWKSLFVDITGFDQIESLDRVKRQALAVSFSAFCYWFGKLKCSLKISFQTAFDLKRASQGMHC